MRTWKIVGGVLALSLVAIATLVIGGFVAGESNMKTFCDTIASGTVIKDVELSAQRNAYRVHARTETEPGSGEYISMISSSATMGRFLCELHHDGSKVRSARYIVMD